MMTTSNEHNNAPAVPQGEPVAWLDLSKLSAGAMVYATGWKSNDKQSPLYTTPAPAPARGEPFGYFRAEPFGWTDCSEDAEGAIALYEHPAHEKHWTENEPVRLPSARTDRVYLAGPMTGIAELNFPAFNQEAERLRAEGLQVLNPADHGIVDGADWADYLRHDIAGLSSCERIHLLRGWTKSKGACLEMTIAKALGMTVTYQVDAEIEHNNAPAVPQGWKLVPIEPTKEMLDAGLKRKAQARWIDGASVLRSRNENLRPAEEIAALQWEAMLATTPAPAPAQERCSTCGYLTSEREHLGCLRRAVKDLDIATGGPYDAQEAATDPNGWCQYVAGMVFCWLQMQKELPPEDQGVAAIAGIIERRLWAYKPAQEVGLTDEDVFEVAEPFGAFQYGDAQGDKRLDFARAIIAALRAKGAGNA